jgi:hypothetical protein
MCRFIFKANTAPLARCHRVSQVSQAREKHVFFCGNLQEIVNNSSILLLVTCFLKMSVRVRMRSIRSVESERCLRRIYFKVRSRDEDLYQEIRIRGFPNPIFPFFAFS